MIAPAKFNVVVIDAEPASRIGVCLILNSHAGLTVCGETESISLGRELCSLHQPHILLLDAELGDVPSFIYSLNDLSTQPKVVVFASHAATSDVQKAFQAGASAYVMRRDPVEALLAAVIDAGSGERRVGPGVERMLLAKLATGKIDLEGKRAEGLSPREREVFLFLGKGWSTREIAGHLGLSIKTIETNQQRIKEKLALGSGGELRRHAALFAADE